MLEVFAENRQFTAQITDQRRLDSSAKNTLFGEKFFLHQKPGAVHQEIFSANHPSYQQRFLVRGLHQVLPYLFPGKRMGNSIYFLVSLKENGIFQSFFFAVCHIFFWLNSFSHSFPGFHFRAFNGRGAIEPLGVAWFGRVVTWEFRKQKMQQKRGETFTCSWVILSVWEYLFIGEVFVLRSPLTHFDTESNIIIEPNAQVTRRSFRNLNCWDFFPRKIWEKGSNWTRRWKRWYINWRTHDTIIIVWDAPHCQ